MAEIVLPPALNWASARFRYIDQTGLTRGLYTGVAQTTANGGDRVGASISLTSCGGASTQDQSKRAQLKAFLMSLRGKQNRVYLTDNSTTRRGLFPASELFTNSDFSSGTTGWNCTADHALSAYDGVLRSTITAASNGNGYSAYQAPSVTQFTPVAVRFIARTVGAFSSGLYSAFNGSFAVLGGSSGYFVGSETMQFGSGAQNAGIVDGNNANVIAGDYVDISFISCARCILVDGGVNTFLRSDEFGNAAWSKTGCSVLTDVFIAADGTNTMDAIQEDASTGVHLVSQNVGCASGAADFMVSCVIAPNFRNFCYLSMQENTSSTVVRQFFNLTTGAVGTTGSTGANWSNRRAFTVNLGSGRILCVLIARKTNAATSITGIVGAATADGTDSYTGNNGVGGAPIGIWRATFAPASVPSRSIQSVAAAVAASSQSGSSIPVKGGRTPSEGALAGALLPGDWIEADGQICTVTASLDLDASGKGVLQLSPPPRRALADNTPIIVHRPMGRFILASDSAEWDNEPGVFSSASIDFEGAPL